MKSTLTRVAAALIVIAAAASSACQAADAAPGRVDVSFEYQRQSGSGSNQFALWVENASGAVVKTLFVTNFTAGRAWRGGGCLGEGGASADIASMSPAEVDAVTKATPASGNVTASWDCRSETGAPVPAGDYTVILEATLRGENSVVYRTPITIGGSAKTSAPEPQYAGSGTAERGMVKNVRMNYTR